MDTLRFPATECLCGNLISGRLAAAAPPCTSRTKFMLRSFLLFKAHCFPDENLQTKINVLWDLGTRKQGMSNKLFREREATALGPSSLKPQQLDAQQKTGETTLESHLGIQNFNERIQRWFGKFVKALKRYMCLG